MRVQDDLMQKPPKQLVFLGSSAGAQRRRRLSIGLLGPLGEMNVSKRWVILENIWKHDHLPANPAVNRGGSPARTRHCAGAVRERVKTFRVY